MVRARPDRSPILPAEIVLPLTALAFPDIDPVIVRLGPLAIHWYGAGYIVGILFGWWYAKRLLSNPRLWGGRTPPIRPEDIDDFVLWAAIGIVARRPARLRALLRPRPLCRQSARNRRALAGRHVLPRRLPRHDAGDGPLRQVAAHPGLEPVRRHRRGRAGGARPRPLRQFHQLRALGPRHRPAVGRRVPERRPAAPPPDPALRGDARRPGAVPAAAPAHPPLPQAGDRPASSAAPSSPSTASPASWSSSSASPTPSSATWPAAG